MLQHLLNALKGRIFHLSLFAGAHLFLETLPALFNLGQIRQTELKVDHLSITGWTHSTGHMNHVVVFKATHHMHDRVDFADVCQELVTKAFTLAGAFHQTGDINELHPRRNELLAVTQIRQLLQPFIRHSHRAHVGLDGAKGEIGGLGLRVGHQGVEEGRLPNVGEANDSGFKHRGNLPGVALHGSAHPFTTGGNDARDC